MRNDDEPLGADPAEHRLDEEQEQLPRGRLVELSRCDPRGSCAARPPCRSPRCAAGRRCGRRPSRARCATRCRPLSSDEVLQHLVALVAHRLLQRLERGRLRHHQVLQARRVGGDAAPRPSAGRPRGRGSACCSVVIRGACFAASGRRRELEQLALRVGDAGAQRHRLARYSFCSSGRAERELPAGEQIGQRARPGPLEHLERLGVAAPFEQLPHRGVVELDAVLEERPAAALVAQRAAFALQRVDGLQEEREARRRCCPASRSSALR